MTVEAERTRMRDEVVGSRCPHCGGDHRWTAHTDFVDAVRELRRRLDTPEQRRWLAVVEKLGRSKT